MWRELALQRWWTDVTVTTDAEGRASLRGFKGDYEMTSGAATAPATIADVAASVELSLP